MTADLIVINVKGVDEEIYRNAKKCAIDEGKNIGDIVTAALREYCESMAKKPETQDAA